MTQSTFGNDYFPDCILTWRGSTDIIILNVKGKTMQEPKKPARLKDIALKCGVSCATVSDVLNGKSEFKGIKDETRDAILQAASDLKYQANINARSIVTGKSNLITALMPSVDNFFYGRIYDSFQKSLNEKGYSVILFLSDWDRQQENKFIEKTIALRAEGCLAVPCFASGKKSSFKEFMDYSVNSVFFDVKPSLSNIDFFHFDNCTGIFAAAGHLLKAGHRNIVMFIRDTSGKPGAGLENERVSGLKKAFNEYDIPFDPSEHVRYISSNEFFDVNDSFASGYHMTAGLFKSKPDTSAILCLNDEFAIGAYTAIREKGLSVPEDVSIIGYGNRQFAEYMFPGLTTLHQDLEKMGKLLAEHLLEKIKGKRTGKDGKEYAIPTPLIERKSTSEFKRETL